MAPHWRACFALRQEANASGAAQKEYIWLDDMPVAVVDDTGSSPVLYFIHTDQLGTPQNITDGSMNIVWDGVFDPFGNPVSGGSGSATWGSAQWGGFNWGATGPSLALTNLRFPGQYFDNETALNQNWNRDYDPTIGRYIQGEGFDVGDIQGERNGENSYTYVDSGPIIEIDPFGLYKVFARLPAPSTEMAALLSCIESKTGLKLTVTSTSTINKQHTVGTPHARGVAADLRYPANPADAAKILCAAGACGAGFGLDEKKHPSQKANGPHVHIQIPNGKLGGHGDIPAKCLPGLGCSNE